MMACGLSKSLGFSSSLKKQQGIVTILGGGGGSNISSAPSLRRTFSADLSSKNWLSSSEKLYALVAEEEEEGSRSGSDIWAQIQEDKNKENHETEPDQTDVWSLILSDKKKASNDTVPPPPYVHPLVKRASSLSEKSLEICTESLGSETGCEGFGDAEIDKEEEEASLVLNVTVTTKEEEVEEEAKAGVEQEAITVPNYELPRGPFPPPIRSLSSQSGSALHMKTRRDNGRLVLEAVSMPSHNNFSAKRQEGRLLLTFAKVSDEPNCQEDETDELMWSEDDEEEEEEEEEEVQDEFAYKPNELLFKLAPKSIGPVTVHRLAHKPIGVPKTNSRWPQTFEEKTDQVVHSLPPRPRVAQLARSMKPPSTVDDTVGATCFNTCDYSWKPANIESLGRNTKIQFQAKNYVNKTTIGVGYDGWINGCKERRRRSLLSIEPFCIATS